VHAPKRITHKKGVSLGCGLAGELYAGMLVFTCHVDKCSVALGELILDPIHSSCCLSIFAGIYRVLCMLFRHVRVEELHQISFDYFFVWKLILGTSMVEERSLVKHRLKRLLDQSDLDMLVLL